MIKLQWVTETPPPRPNASQTQEDVLLVTLDDLRAEYDADLARRWADVENDPALCLDMSDGGFYWEPAELAEATDTAMRWLFSDDDAPE